jgi:hypothetical protein
MSDALKQESVKVTTYSRTGTCEHDSDCHKMIWARKLCRSHYEKMKQLNVGRVRTKETALPNSEDVWNFVISELKRQNHPIATKLRKKGE